jgi:ferredoxin
MEHEEVMSRFRIRERLKSRLLGQPAAPEQHEQVDLTLVLPDGTEHRVLTEPHYTLVMASQTLDTPIHAHCPDGHCGKCQVQVLAGMDALRPPTDAETALLDEHLGADRDPAVRLACHTRLQGSGARIQVNTVWSLAEAMGESSSDD